MNSYPNSDCKQCTESKLGWVHNVHTQQPRPRAHCARSAQVVGAAARTTPMSQACRAHSQRRPRAQRAQVARIAPRSWAHVATSLPCQVQPLKSRHHSRLRPPGGHPMSRHHIGVATPISPLHVKTSHWCRDTVSPAQHQARSHPMSRLQFHVVTSWTTNLCRDIKFMSRPQFPAGQVATLVPCRDLLETI